MPGNWGPAGTENFNSIIGTISLAGTAEDRHEEHPNIVGDTVDLPTKRLNSVYQKKTHNSLENTHFLNNIIICR
jgi:hypothetical protein